MFRNYLSAAWGDLARSPIQSLIAIGGLAIGLAAAIITGILTVNVFGYDHFIPGHERLYMPVMETHSSRGDQYLRATSYNLARNLAPFPEIEAMARVQGVSTVLRHGNVLARDAVDWADPNFFHLYRVPVVHGDLEHALDRPDGMVVSRAVAEKYFSRDDVVGQALELDHAHLMTVRAVIADFPANASNYTAKIFASGSASFSALSLDENTQGMSPNGGLATNGTTLVQLASGASVESLNRKASAMVARFVPASLPYRRAVHFERLDEIPMSARLNPGNRAHLYVAYAIMVIILILSCVNFVKLSIARSARRGLEVAVRKAAGASRRTLVAQFLGEAMLQALLALVVAVALVEWSLPAVNVLFNAGAEFDYWHDPVLLAAMLAGTLAIGALAGIYPALILSAFRPAAVLKGLWSGISGKAWLRQAFVGLQFAALIVFLISAGVVFAQNAYSTREAMRVDGDQTLLLRMDVCSEGLRERIAALPGVRGAACSSLRVLPDDVDTTGMIPHRGGEMVNVYMIPVDFGFFELYGVKPVAGRLFRAGTDDRVPDNPPPGQTIHYVINEAAVHQLGFASPAAALGQAVRFPPRPDMRMPGVQEINPIPGTIIGVVRDFSFTPETYAQMSNLGKIPPTAYSVGSAEFNFPAKPALLHVKLAGHDIPETLAAIDKAWTQSGARDPINRQFLDAYVQNQEQATLREGQLFAVLAGLTMLLACLGLFGVSLSVTARRIKEIGVRKAMGARDRDVLGLLLWQFARPALWANLLAWPVAFWAMESWLASFAYHIDLSLWLFPAAGAAALMIALLTVAGQALLAARQKPVLALRCE